jgi:hypothetical protein
VALPPVAVGLVVLLLLLPKANALEASNVIKAVVASSFFIGNTPLD